MKSEKFIQLMWAKGLYVNNQLYKTQPQDTLKNKKIKTLNNFYKIKLQYRLEARNIYLTPRNNLLINLLLATYSSLNATIDLNYALIVLRLYLIKSYKGKSTWLNKPTNGQRTWSNASTINFTATKYKKYLKLNNWC